MSQQCPVHNIPFKMVPAGVSSKTGRPYEAFWSCPEKGCRMRPGDVQTGRGGSALPHVPPSPAVAVVTNPGTSSKASGASPKLLLLLGCMDFASRVFQGTAQGDDAGACAQAIYDAYRGEVE